jgi:hypothetical protein
MELENVEILELELKYCERCGGLWLRVQGRQDVYCFSCAGAMSEVAIGFRSRRAARLPIHRNIDGPCGTTTPFDMKGGHA